MSNLGNHESPTRQPIGDMTPGWGAHVPGRIPAQALQQAQYGYRPTPNRKSMTSKFQIEEAAKVPELRRLQTLLQATNLTTQDHPIQDFPYFGEGIYFTTGTTNILAGATLDFALVTIGYQNMGFLRSMKATLISALAAADLRVSILVNSHVVNSIHRVPLVIFEDIYCKKNCYARLMSNQVVVLRIENDGAGAHDFRVSILGWQYLASKLSETPQGAMPKPGV